MTSTSSPTPTTKGPAREPRRVGFLTLRAFIVCSLLLALAIGGFVWAFVTSPDHPTPITQKSVAVVVVGPKPGEQVLRQSTVFIELDGSYELVDLQVGPKNGAKTSVKTAKLAGLNRYSWAPGITPDSDTLPGGDVCVDATYRPLDDSGSSTRTYTWCFSVH